LEKDDRISLDKGENTLAGGAPFYMPRFGAIRQAPFG
jgi:hypothetical protein